MGLFNRSNEVVLSNGYEKRGFGMPAWLMWLGSGVLVGALGLIWVQDRYGPQRLSVAESREIQASVDKANEARDELQRQVQAQGEQNRQTVAALTAELDRTRSTLQARINESANADGTIEQLRMDLALFDEVMPPDPRRNPVGVRAARVAQQGNDLRYHVLLTRENETATDFKGVMQLVVRGNRASGAQDTITLDAVPIKVGAYQHIKGVSTLPQGFIPRQTSIHVYDKPEGSSVGMRIIQVQQG